LTYFVRRTLSNFAADTKRFVPRRALMYVPSSDEKKIAKIGAGLAADCIVLDCEDGVAFNRKQEARENAAKFLSAGNFPKRQQIGIRVNSAASGFLDEDLRTIGEASNLTPAIMFPQVETLKDLNAFSSSFRNNFNLNRFQQHTSLVIWIESAIGLINMPTLLQAAQNMTHGLPLLLDAVVFGSDDFCASIGAQRSKEASELLYARQHFVTTCKAFGLQAIDIVFIDYKDLDGLKKQCIEAAQFGFTGKQVIHPAQVPIVQEAFLPSKEKIEWAKELLEEFKKQEATGKGAITFRGMMIDAPLVLQAKNIVQMIENIQH